MMKKIRVAAALSCFLTLGTLVGPLGSPAALAAGCSPVEVDVPSLSIELTPRSRTVRRGRNAWIGVRVTRISEGIGNTEVAVPARGVSLYLSLVVGDAHIVDGAETDRRGRATLKMRIPTSSVIGKADAYSSAHGEVTRAGCVVVNETGQIEVLDFLRIRA